MDKLINSDSIGPAKLHVTRKITCTIDYRNKRGIDGVYMHLKNTIKHTNEKEGKTCIIQKKWRVIWMFKKKQSLK